MDARSDLEKVLWDKVGPPLYYCSDCLLAVSVTPIEGGEPIVKRKCEHTGQIMAPRKSILAGKGGLSFPNKIKMAGYQMGAALTGRCV
jgi:hypothetical protein